MKRILAILCVIAVLCGLCVPAMAAAVDLGGLNSLALVGTGVPGAADWTPGDAAGDFVKVSNGVYVKVITVTAGHAMKFKIAGNDAWDDAYNFGGMEDGVVVALGTKVELANGGGSKDLSLTAAKDGNLKFTVDLNGDVPTLLVEETTDAVTGPSGPSTPSTPSAPATPSSLALAGTGIPGAADWTPGDPAGDFTQASKGVYVKVITVTAGHAMTFKIAGNDAWDDNFNYGGAADGVVVAIGTKLDLTNGSGSKDLSLTATKDCNLKFTVDLTGGVPTLLVEETTDEATGPSEPGEPSTPSTPSGDTYTLHAMVPADWKNPCIWCWDGSAMNPSDLGSWPGNYTMKQDADGWWTIQIPAGYTNVLVNANSGAVQTIDITGLTGQEVWIDAVTNTAQPTVHYEKVEVTIPDPTEPSATTGRPTVKPAGKTDEGAIDWAATLLYAGIGSAVVVVIAAIVLVLILVLKKRK